MKEIELHGKYSDGKSTIVDDEDYEYLNQFSWYVSKKGYVETSIPVKLREGYPVKHMQMQRMLMLNSITEEGQLVDHKNRNKLDNRRENLRLCTMSESNRNRCKPHRKYKQEKYSFYKGVCWDKESNNWRASISIDGKQTDIGHFDNEQDAAIAYNEAAKKYFGVYAYLNEI